MGNCKDCKHWGTTESGHRPFADGNRRCHQIEKVLDQDGEPFGGPAALATPGEFGCVLFEAKAAI